MLHAAAVLAWLLAGSAWAAEVQVLGLTEVRVAMGADTSAQRRAAFERAIGEALARLSGLRRPHTHKALHGVIDEAENYVDQYRSWRDQAQGGWTLWMRFDQAALEQALQAAGLPVWETRRPATIAWVVAERDGRRQLVGADDDGGLRVWMEDQARARGIPLLLPLLDLRDLEAVDVAQVRGGFMSAVRGPSARYGAESILIGRLQPEGSGQWVGHWVHEYHHRRSEWTTRGNAESAVREAIHFVVDRLAARQSAATGREVQRLRVAVDGVQGFEDYRALRTRLEQLTSLRDLRLVQASPETLILEMPAGGGREALARTLERSAGLVPIPLQSTDQSGLALSVDLEFRWLP